MPSTMSSSTSRPASIASLALTPSSVPFATAARNRSSGGDLGDTETLDETLRLRALAGAGRTQENDTHSFFKDRSLPLERLATLPAAPLEVKRDPLVRPPGRCNCAIKGHNRPLAALSFRAPTAVAAVANIIKNREARMKKPAKKNAFYAQSGGVSAVINASAAGVIETAMKQSKVIGKVYARPARHHRRPHGRPHRREQRKRRHHPRGSSTPRRVPSAPRASSSRASSRTAPIRAPHRGLQGARHRVFLLQRRQRLHGHRAQGLADRRVPWATPITCVGVPKTVDNDLPHTGLLSRFRLGREICRRLHARGGTRCRVHGAHPRPRSLSWR